MEKFIYDVSLRKILRGSRPRILILLNLVIILIMTPIIPGFAADNLDKLVYMATEEVKPEAAGGEDLVKYTTEKFTDIKESDWYIGIVAKLVGLGIIDGYPDGTFKPQEEINADAFIKMTITALGHNLEKGGNSWAEPYIERAKEIDIVKIGEFSDYTRPINRGEIARIIIRALEEEYPDNLEDYTYRIKDYDSIPDGFKEYVLKAYVKGIVTGYPDGSFGYDKNATRAEASAMLTRMLDEGERKVLEKEEIAERTKELSEEDIERLQSYEQYKLTGDGKVSKNYKDFEAMYEEERSECEAIYNDFSPLKYRDYHNQPLYTNAEIKFISSPKLIYKTLYLDKSIRGVIQIRYKSKGNPYNLNSNQWYECDAEYYYRYTTDKEYIREFKHLSEWKLVK